MAAAGNSLNIHRVLLFSLFLFEKFLLFKPAGPSKHLASHTAQPGSLPRILQQTQRHWAWGFSCPGPPAHPRDLIVLKHFPYCLIFQCPLQCLVSNLHVCWKTIGCSLCSLEDQLGILQLPGGKWTPLPAISLPSHAEIFDETTHHPGHSAAPTAHIWGSATSGFSQN